MATLNGMSEIQPTPPGFQQTYERIKAILSEARAGAYRAINAAMVAAYWEIGRVIVEQEQQGHERAEYGQALIAELSIRLKSEFGKGFDPSNLAKMRAFHLAYPILDALRPKLSWTHYRLLLRVEKPEARAFYEAEAVNSRWSTRELERQIHSLTTSVRLPRPTKTRPSAWCFAPTRARLSCVTRCPRTISRFSPPTTSSTCPRKRNWLSSCSASGRPSRWKAACGKRRTNDSGGRRCVEFCG